MTVGKAKEPYVENKDFRPRATDMTAQMLTRDRDRMRIEQTSPVFVEDQAVADEKARRFNKESDKKPEDRNDNENLVLPEELEHSLDAKQPKDAAPVDTKAAVKETLDRDNDKDKAGRSGSTGTGNATKKSTAKKSAAKKS